MTLKTNFVDGDIFYTGDTTDNDKLNGITNEVNLKNSRFIKHFEHLDEEDPGVVATFNLTAPVGSYITKIIFEAEGKRTATYSDETWHCLLKIEGTNLGTRYPQYSFARLGISGITDRGEYSYFSNSSSNIVQGATTGFSIRRAVIDNILEIKDTTTAFEVSFSYTAGATDGKVRNIKLTIIYDTNIIEV